MVVGFTFTVPASVPVILGGFCTFSVLLSITLHPLGTSTDWASAMFPY